jgi:DNA-binding NarL/FixJ family response regulator
MEELCFYWVEDNDAGVFTSKACIVTIRVLLAEDHPLVAEGLKLALAQDGFEVVGNAPTGRQAVELASKLEPDVVLLDIQLPEIDGIEALNAIKTTMPNTKVIMLTGHASQERLAQAIGYGASGFLLKDNEPRNISIAIRIVASGGAIIDRDLLATSLEQLGGEARVTPGLAGMQPSDLTQQERRVLVLIAKGHNNASIAETLDITRNTVKSHLHNIFAKLEVTNRTQAAIWAMRNGLVT